MPSVGIPYRTHRIFRTPVNLLVTAGRPGRLPAQLSSAQLFWKNDRDPGPAHIFEGNAAL